MTKTYPGSQTMLSQYNAQLSDYTEATTGMYPTPQQNSGDTKWKDK